MRAIINRTKYDTETATLIGETSHGWGRDHGYYSCGLYRTRTGRYFLAGKGGPASMFAQQVGNSSIGGSGIVPLEEGEALDFAERHSLLMGMLDSWYHYNLK